MALKYKDSLYLSYSGALLVTSDIPLDIRSVVASKEELLKEETWQVIGSTEKTAYKGMIVSVENEDCPYICINPNAVTLEASWKKIGVDLDIEGTIVDIVKWKKPEGDDLYYESTDTAHLYPITHPCVLAGGEGQYIKLVLGSDVAYIKTSTIIDLKNYYTKTEIDTSINNALSIRDTSIHILDISVNNIEEILKDGIVSSFKALGANYIKVAPTSDTHGAVTLDVSIQLVDCSNNTSYKSTGVASDKYIEERFAWEVITQL